MDFKNMFLLINAVLIVSYTTDALHVDMEEMLENRQEQLAMTTTTESAPNVTGENSGAESSEANGNEASSEKQLPSQNNETKPLISDSNTESQNNASSTNTTSVPQSAKRNQMSRQNLPDSGTKPRPNKTRPVLWSGNSSTPVCKYTGPCRGKSGKQCPPNSSCEYIQGNTNGWCCKIGPDTEFCPSGVTGPSCVRSKDCKAQYTCRFGKCCRDQDCPAGWNAGGSCNIKGRPKCKQGYECITGMCCKIPDNLCPSGVVGPVCSEVKPCKSGFSCRFGYCCRNKVCPKGWTKGGICNMRAGQSKCRAGFQCIDGICCLSKRRLEFRTSTESTKHTTPTTVPSQTTPVLISKSKGQRMHRTDLRKKCNGTPVGKCGGPSSMRCPRYSQCTFLNTETGSGICCRTRPVCLSGYMGKCGGVVGKQCPYGSTCKYLQGNTEGWCCKKETCPHGADGVCGTILGLTCREGTTCRFMQKGVADADGKCCVNNPKEEFCPSGIVGQACRPGEPCESGYTCRYGYCCRDNSCPRNWTPGGICNLSPGAAACRDGYTCIEGFCCRVPEIVCPSGIVGPTCSGRRPCKQGYSCRFGYCCRDPRCPYGGIDAGACNFVPGKPKCDVGYRCMNNYCCLSKTNFLKYI